MSKYCGKCDVWDTLIMIHELNDESDWDKVRIIQNGERLNINSVKDLLPYAAFIIGAMSANGDQISAHITDESYVFTMERERLGWVVNEAQRIYKKCKRKKLDFDVEEVAAQISCPWSTDDYVREIVKQVKEHPYSPNVKDITYPLCDYYKQMLYKDMVDVGYDEKVARLWCFKGIKEF